MRALKVAIVLVLGCLAGSCDDDEPAGGASKVKVVCCKLEAPSCSGPIAGTNPDGSCRRAPQDAAPVNWRIENDENGCPRYVIGSQSCLSPRPPQPDSGTKSELPVGASCTDDDQCGLYPTGQCGVYDPTPVCAIHGCEPTAPNRECDERRGTCLSAGPTTVCLPRCTFGDDGAAPKGCAPRNGCNYAGIESTGDAGSRGFGYCVGGCTADADCGPSRKCQRELGLCSWSFTPTKSVGDPCVTADAYKTCLCETGASGAGYCTHACRVETDEVCPTGFTCDANLPVEFAKAPRDMGGRCKKICMEDADCAGLSAKCVAGGGLSVKVCRPE